MAMNETACDAIVQQGRVISCEPGLVRVEIKASSACASCHAKGACPMGEEKVKVIEAACPEGQFQAGDLVEVSLDRSAGHRALGLGYLVPFVVVVAVLIVSQALGGSELQSGCTALAALIPYYFCLFLLKDRMKKDFQFTVKHV